MNHNVTPQNPWFSFWFASNDFQGQNNISNSPARPESFHSALVNDENDVENPCLLGLPVYLEPVAPSCHWFLIFGEQS